MGWGERIEVLPLTIQLSTEERMHLYAEAVMHGVTMEELAHRRATKPETKHHHCDEDPVECSHQVRIGQILEAIDALHAIREGMEYMNSAIVRAYGQEESLVPEMRAAFDRLEAQLIDVAS